MLALFAFSVTPKFLLHALFANHKDTVASRPASNRVELSTAGFHCDVDNLVVESPFLFQHTTLDFTIPVVFPTFQNRPNQFWSSPENHVSCLRGPPSVA
jgi:hypothetical protein